MTDFLDVCYDAIKLQGKGIPKTIESVPSSNLEQIKNKRLVFVGCGDSYAVAEYGKYVFLSVHMNAISLSPPELKRIPLDENTLVVGITASGRSIATIDALEYAKKENAVTVTLTDNPTGSTTEIADYVWMTKSGVDSYNISPSVPTTSAMAYLLKLAALEEAMPHSRLSDDSHYLTVNSENIIDWAENTGKEISQIVDITKPLYVISDGPNFVAAQLGMMKFDEYSLVKGIAALREEFQHHYNLSINNDDCAVLITDAPIKAVDKTFMDVLTNTLNMQVYHLWSDKKLLLASPFGQAIANAIALQMAAYHTTLRYNPGMQKFKQPHADAFKIY